MNSLKKILPTIFALCVICMVIASIVFLIWDANQYSEYSYSLSELSDGIYGWYYRVSSNVPAQNYEVITLCCNGMVITYQGDIVISYTDKDPCVTVKDTNLVNGDTVYVYVPYGSIAFHENVGV